MGNCVTKPQAVTMESNLASQGALSCARDGCRCSQTTRASAPPPPSGCGCNQTTQTLAASSSPARDEAAAVVPPAGPGADADADIVFVCAGTCRDARIRPGHCQIPNCSMYEEPMLPVEAVYICPSCSVSSIYPTRCSTSACKQNGELLECRARVSQLHQVPVLDPPEEKRTYSSVWDKNEIGTGHARSILDSLQGWSAGSNDTMQWMIMDAGYVVDAVAGLAIKNRADACFNQLVTHVAVDMKLDEGDDWIEHVNDQPTNISVTQNVVSLLFTRPVRARFIRVRPLQWQEHISMRCGLVLHGKAAAAFRQTNSVEYRPVWDLNQWPVKIPHAFVPGGLPPHTNLPLRPYGVARLPGKRCVWQGRQSAWSVLEFNGKQIDNADTRVFAVMPSQRCSILVGFRAWWERNRDDYCPGCVVQLYYGMFSTFCTGVVEHGLHNHRGQSRTEFQAPKEPGLYYITTSISLMYNYVDNLSHHHNTHENAFAAVRVLPTVFSPEVFPVLSSSSQRQFIAILAWSNRSDTVFSTLDRNVLFGIFSCLLGQDS